MSLIDVAGEHGMAGDARRAVSTPIDAAQALALLVRITVGATACVRSSFESDLTSNRAVQLLISIGLSPGVTPGAIGKRLGLSPSMVSQLLARVRTTGFVRSDADPRDRRVSRLQLTPLGLERVGALDEALGRWFADNRELMGAAARHLGATEACSDPLEAASALEAAIALAGAGAGYVAAATERASRGGLTDPNERLALALIHTRGAMRPAELARALRLGSSGTAGLLNRLEAAGLAYRRNPGDPADRRAVEVVLTEVGAALAQELAELLLEHAAPLVGGLQAAAAVAARTGAA